MTTKLEELKTAAEAADANAYANPYANCSVSARNSYFGDIARDAARAEADVAWDAYYYELKKHERTLMTNLMSKLMTTIKKLKVDWNAHTYGSASVLSKLAAWEAAVYTRGDAVDAYGDAVDAYGDAYTAAYHAWEDAHDAADLDALVASAENDARDVYKAELEKLEENSDEWA